MADVNAILAATPATQPANPLAIMSGWQDYANKIATNRQIQAATANTEQATARSQFETQMAMAQRHAQLGAQYSNMSDQQLQGGAPLYQGLEDERNGGQLSDQQYGVLKAQLDRVTQASGGAGAAYRPIINGMMASNLTAVEQLKAMVPKVLQTDIGGQQVSQAIPSDLAMLNNPCIAGVYTTGQFVNKTLAPGYQDVGPLKLPVGGAIGSPPLQNGVSPETASSIQTVTNPVTGNTEIARNTQMGGLPQGGYVTGGTPGGGGAPANNVSAPPPGGYRLPGAGGQTPQAGGTMGVGGNAPGGLLSQPISINPQAVQAIQQNFTNYREALNAQPALKTGEQTLVRLAKEIQASPTGPGADQVQAFRNYLSTLNGLMGGPINQNDINAANYDEMGKDMNQLQSLAGSNTHLASQLESVIHGNPNTVMNRLANSNVTTIFTGINRQKQLEVMLTKNKDSGRDFQQARDQAINTDPRALALDTMTPTMLQQTLAELQKDDTARKKFMRTLGLADQAKMHIGPLPPQLQGQ